MITQVWGRDKVMDELPYSLIRLKQAQSVWTKRALRCFMPVAFLMGLVHLFWMPSIGTNDAFQSIELTTGMSLLDVDVLDRFYSHMPASLFLNLTWAGAYPLFVIGSLFLFSNRPRLFYCVRVLCFLYFILTVRFHLGTPIFYAESIPPTQVSVLEQELYRLEQDGGEGGIEKETRLHYTLAQIAYVNDDPEKARHHLYGMKQGLPLIYSPSPSFRVGIMRDWVSSQGVQIHSGRLGDTLPISAKLFRKTYLLLRGVIGVLMLGSLVYGAFSVGIFLRLKRINIFRKELIHARA